MIQKSVKQNLTCCTSQHTHLFPWKSFLLIRCWPGVCAVFVEPHACAVTCVGLRLVSQSRLSSVCQYINHTAHSSVFLLSFSLSFLNFSLMFNCSYDPVNNSFCLSSQSPFVPAIELEALMQPLNKLQGHGVELDENCGSRVWKQEYFFWFGNVGLWMSLFAFRNLSSFFW